MSVKQTNCNDQHTVAIKSNIFNLCFIGLVQKLEAPPPKKKDNHILS